MPIYHNTDASGKRTFDVNSGRQRGRKSHANFLLSHRHPNAEPDDARPFLAALGHCAATEDQLSTLVRRAKRHWPKLAAELGNNGLMALAREKFGRRMTNRAFGKLLKYTHAELMAYAKERGTNNPRQWVQECDRTKGQIEAKGRVRKRILQRVRRNRVRIGDKADKVPPHVLEGKAGRPG